MNSSLKCFSRINPDENNKNNDFPILDKNKGRDNDILSEILAGLNAKKPDIKQNPETPKIYNGGETPEQVSELPVDASFKSRRTS